MGRPLTIAIVFAVGMAAAAAAAPIPVTEAGCDRDDSATNRCVDRLRHELMTSCATLRTDCSLELGPGSFYLFGEPAGTSGTPNLEVFTLDHMNNVRIRGSGTNQTRLVLADVGTVFRLVETTNVAFSNFTITSVRVPYTFGVAISETEVSFDESRYPVNVTRWPWLADGVFANSYAITHGSLGSPDMQGRFGHVYYDQVHSTPAAVTYPSPGVMSLSGLKGPLTVGEPTVIRHAKFKDVTFSLYDATNVSISDVRIHSGVGQAIACTTCGGIDVTRTAVVPDAGEPLSVNAGGIVLGGVRRGEGVRVVDSTVIGTGDDTFNVVTHYCVVSAISSDRTTITIDLSALGASMTYFAVQRGIQFVNSSNMAVLTRATIQEVGRTTLTLSNPLPASITAQPHNEPSLRAGLWQLVVFADESVASPVVLTGNRFGRNIGRNVLMRGVDVTISDNTFEYALGPAVLMNNDLCVFFGGAVITNATITRNVILSPLLGGMANPISNAYGAMYLGAHVLVPRYERNGQLSPHGECVQATASGAGRLLYHNVDISDNVFTFEDGLGASVLPTFEGSLTAGLSFRNNTVVRMLAANGSMPALPHNEVVVGAESRELGTISGNTCAVAAPNGTQWPYIC